MNAAEARFDLEKLPRDDFFDPVAKGSVAARKSGRIILWLQKRICEGTLMREKQPIGTIQLVKNVRQSRANFPRSAEARCLQLFELK